MKVLVVCLIALILCVAAFTSATVVEKKHPKVLMAMPKSLTKDPSIVNLPPMIGLPFGDFSTKSDAEINRMLDAQFPLLFTNSSVAKFTSEKKKNEAMEIEVLRFAIFKSALTHRANPGDEKALALSGKWECPACKFAVEKMEDLINDSGCDLTSDALGDICAAIPVVGVVSVPACIEVLKWACGKILELIEDHIKDPAEICDRVFHLKC